MTKNKKAPKIPKIKKSIASEKTPTIEGGEPKEKFRWEVLMTRRDDPSRGRNVIIFSDNYQKALKAAYDRWGETYKLWAWDDDYFEKG